MKFKRKQFTALFLTLLLLAGCTPAQPEETAPATLPVTVPTTAATVPPTTVPPTTVPPTTVPPTTEPPVLLELSAEERTMLLKIAMAEVGRDNCAECAALVMCTLLNRVNAPNRFGSSIRSVLYAEDQFTPIWDGTYDTAVPNNACYLALDMVIRGWDESQGALFYEFCEGESWHSKNLQLLTEHCNTRFYQ